MVGPVDLDGSPWQVLGVEPTSDTQVIRRAYAGLVRQYRPDSHPLEFAKVREAYEHALEMARHLQWQEEIDAAQAVEQAEPAGATAGSGDESVIAPEPVEPVEQAAAVVAAVPAPAIEAEPEVAQAAFPVFDPHQALSELATTYNDKGDAAAGALLRDHIAQTAQSTIDARLDYEWLFLRSLLVSDTPPLALVFEGDRCFRWSSRLDDVARMFDDRGARRLAELIDMADEWMFSRSFAANPWQRRLFADAADRMPWFGMTSLVFGARNVVTRWHQQCEALQTPALEGRLHPVARRRLEGRVLLSSDVVVGLLGAWLVLSIGAETGFSWWVALLGVAVAVLLAAACVGLRWVNRQPWMTRVHALKPWTSGWRLVVAGTVVGAAFIGALIFGGSDQPVAARIAAGVVSALLFLGFVLAIGGLFWSIAFAIETLLSQLLLKPLWAVSAQSFRSVRDDASGWTPMTLVQKVRAMPAAMSADRAARKRSEAERALREPFEKPKSSFNGWWLFFLIVIVINAIRVLSGK